MASFTEKAIKSAFLKLLNERPLAQITVKDVVLECGINRNSFYYHFQDIPSLLEEIIKEDADAIIEESAGVTSLEQCLSTAIEFALKNRKAVWHIYNSASRELYETYLNRISLYAVEKYIDTALGEHSAVSDEDREMLINFIRCELIGQIMVWMQDGMKYDISARFTKLAVMLTAAANSVIKPENR